MKVLISEKLSEHKYKTPEGYLICTDAILARTGKQSYTKDELFQDGDNTEVNVDRPYNEVMNAKTIASFENKPITFDHPDEDVNVGNYKDYAIGYVRDVHQGKTNKGEDVILGNLVITDQEAINAIEQGDHTDLSCGYDCDIRDDGNGNYSQTNIRGNHLALCEQGRAGIAHIVDSKMNDSLSKKEKELCDYMLENALDDGEDENDLLKKMKVYYSEYSNLARSKSNEVLQYFKSHIVDSKARDSKIEGVSPELLLSASEWLEDKIYIERKYHVKIYNITSNKGLTVTGSRQDLEKLYKDYHLKDYYGLKIVDSKVEDDNLLGKKVRIRKRYSNLDGTIGTIFSYEGTNYDDEVEVERNGHIYKVDYEDIEFLDSKARDLVNDSGELVVGRWYDFAKKIKVTKNEYAKSLRITGKSGNVYSYTIYLKNGELYDRGTYSEIKERFNIKDSVVDSKVEDVNYSEKEIKEAAMKLLKQKPFLTYEEALQKVKENIRNGNYLLDNKIEDIGWKTTKMASGIIHELGNMRIIEEENEKGDIQYRIGGTNGQVFSSLEKAKNAIRRKHLDEIEDNMNDVKDSKEMTMSDAIKMLNIVDIYKKVKDASKNEWVIKNTGLAYEIWNQGKMVKKFPTKKLAIEWIHSRFPTDKITEDSTKDGRLWSTLTRKAKH